MKKIFKMITLISILSLMSIIPCTAQQEASLVGYWPFDEGKGEDVIDQSGNGNDGTIKGDVKWVNGKFNKALDFTPGAYVEIPDSDTLRDMDEYTAALWINFNEFSADWNHILEKDGSYGITVNSGGGDFRFTPNSGKVWLESKFKPKAGTWYYITMTANSSAITFYVDAVKQSDAQEAVVFNNNTITIAHGPSYMVNAVIDEVKFWAKALSPDDIAVAMKGDAAVTPGVDKVTSTWARVKSQ